MSKSRSTTFRPSGVTQHNRDSRELRISQAQFQKAHPHDTAPGRTAAEWFAHLRPRLLASRPMLGHGKKTKRLADGLMHGIAPVFGAPTFRNVIDENGDHV